MEAVRSSSQRPTGDPSSSHPIWRRGGGGGGRGVWARGAGKRGSRVGQARPQPDATHHVGRLIGAFLESELELGGEVQDSLCGGEARLVRGGPRGGLRRAGAARTRGRAGQCPLILNVAFVVLLADVLGLAVPEEGDSPLDGGPVALRGLRARWRRPIVLSPRIPLAGPGLVCGAGLRVGVRAVGPGPRDGRALVVVRLSVRASVVGAGPLAPELRRAGNLGAPRGVYSAVPSLRLGRRARRGRPVPQEAQRLHPARTVAAPLKPVHWAVQGFESGGV